MWLLLPLCHATVKEHPLLALLDLKYFFAIEESFELPHKSFDAWTSQLHAQLAAVSTRFISVS
jgi:hypothetical protein